MFSLLRIVVCNCHAQNKYDEVFLPINSTTATKPTELNMHSTGTEAADEDECSRWNMERQLCVTLLKAKSKQKLPLLPLWMTFVPYRSYQTVRHIQTMVTAEY